MPTINLGRVGFVQKGTYNPSTPYKVNDVVTSDGQVFACIVANTGEALTDTVYWSPWVSVQGIISDSTPLETKAYSGYKTQQLHDSQAEALANLATASGKIQNETLPVFNGIPLVLTDMPFSIITDSTNTDIIEFDDVANTITFKIDASYNFISTVEFESSTNQARTIDFALINTSNGSVVVQETATLETASGDIEIIPFNTLLTLGKNGMPSAPLTIKIKSIASGTGYKLNRFSSILASSNSYESSTTAASQVIVTPVGNIGATTVQIALQELDSEKASDADVIHTTGDETKAGVLTFTSIPKAPTSTAGNNTTNVATTAFVKTAIDAQNIITNSSIDAVLNVAQNTQSTSYTLALSDRGKSIDTSAGVTVPLNSVVAFPIGSVITITNTSSAAITITQTAGVTLRNAGTTKTGNCTLANYGMATLRKIATDTWFISGAGVS